MYPTVLTQLARANPFSVPLFSLQKVEEPKQSLPANGQNRRLAAAAVAGKVGMDGPLQQIVTSVIRICA